MFAALLATVGVSVTLISPPMLLSLADAAAGGGSGVKRTGSGLPFGAHGQTLDVWRPSARTETPRPVLIFWYGGSWVRGSRRAYAFAARAFASAGYVVVMPDYRKGPAGRFPAMLVDGAEAVAWVRDHISSFGGDPGRIAIAGHSAGAYNVGMLALDQSWLRKAGVDPAIIRAGVGLSGPYDFYPFTAQSAADAMQGADPAATQPINFTHRDAPPLLLVTSTGDTAVRPKNAINLAGKLEAAGAPVTLKIYPELGHAEVAMALSKPFRGKAPVLADSIAFLNRETAAR